MKTNHTPGPWTHIGTTNAAGTPIPGEVVSASAGATVCVVPHARPMAIERLTADAVLIAAAPEMLSALRRAFEYLDNIPETSAGGDDEAVEIARAAKAAIKQAMVVAP